MALKTVDVVLLMIGYSRYDTAYLAMMANRKPIFFVLLRILQSMWEYVNNAFWDISMARCENDKAFIEEEDCDWP